MFKSIKIHDFYFHVLQFFLKDVNGCFLFTAISTRSGAFDKLGVLLYGRQVKELRSVQQVKDGIEIGAAVTVTELGNFLKDMTKDVDGLYEFLLWAFFTKPPLFTRH